MKKYLQVILIMVMGAGLLNAAATRHLGPIVSGTAAQGNNANVATGDGDIYAADAIEADGDLNIAGDSTLAGNLDVNGSLLLNVTQITDAETILTTTQAGYIIVTPTTSIKIYLPAVSGNTGLTYTIKLDSAAIAVPTITIDANASELIDGLTTCATINDWYDYIVIVCDGDEWFITAEKEH